MCEPNIIIGPQKNRVPTYVNIFHQLDDGKDFLKYF